MSGPLSSLKKRSSMPLNAEEDIGKLKFPFSLDDSECTSNELPRSLMPFRRQLDSSDAILERMQREWEKLNVSDVSQNRGNSNSTHTASSNVPRIAIPSKKHSGSMSNTNGSDNDDFISTLVSRVGQLEKELRATKETLKLKSERVRRLEQKCTTLEDHIETHLKTNKISSECSPQSSSYWEAECNKLKRKVTSMEGFFQDYGLTWVGEDDDVKEKPPVTVSSTQRIDGSISTHRGQRQDSSEENSIVDYCAPSNAVLDKIISNIKELNVLAGDGISTVTQTPGGPARLTISDPVPFTLYQNGFMLWEGPLRPYIDIESETFLNDLFDGYFPTEMKERFPEGVPLKVYDCRSVLYLRNTNVFSGQGTRLGGGRRPSRLIPSKIDFDDEVKTYDFSSFERKLLRSSVGNTPVLNKQNVATVPAPITNVTEAGTRRFIDKLPEHVVHDGKLVGIRDDIADLVGLSSSRKHDDGGIISTQKANSISKNTDIESLSENMTTLQIRSKNSEAFVLSLSFFATITMLRAAINKHRYDDSAYVIRTAFPNRTYEDNNATLKECSLVPSATLHLTPVCT